MCCSKRQRRARDPALRVPIDEVYPGMNVPSATLDSAVGPVASPKDNTPSLGSLLSKCKPSTKRQDTPAVGERVHPDQEAGMGGRRFGIELEPRRVYAVDDQIRPESPVPWEPYTAHNNVLEIRLDEVSEVNRYSQLLEFDGRIPQSPVRPLMLQPQHHLYGSRRRVSSEVQGVMLRNIEAWAQGVEDDDRSMEAIEGTDEMAEAAHDPQA